VLDCIELYWNEAMPYLIHWYDEDQTILRVDIQGHVTWDMWHHTVDQICKHLAETPHRVDIIYVDEVGFPKGNALPHMKQTLDQLVSYPNLGLVFTVSRRELSMLVKIVLDIVMRAFAIDTSHYGGFVRTIEEAIANIQEAREQNGVHT
jgi:nucleoside-triphosphatase THEP1